MGTAVAVPHRGMGQGTLLGCCPQPATRSQPLVAVAAVAVAAAGQARLGGLLMSIRASACRLAAPLGRRTRWSWCGPRWSFPSSEGGGPQAPGLLVAGFDVGSRPSCVPASRRDRRRGARGRNHPAHFQGAIGWPSESLSPPTVSCVADTRRGLCSASAATSRAGFKLPRAWSARLRRLGGKPQTLKTGAGRAAVLPAWNESGERGGYSW